MSTGVRAGVSRAAAISLTGLEGTTVLVEAGVSKQLPGMAIIGLPDTAVAEAKQRVRLAIQQAGMKVSDRFIVVNLSPAAVPKQGSGFDLAIALAVLGASNQLSGTRLEGTAHLGELSLDGGVRRPPGLLGAVLAARGLGFERVMVPLSAVHEAALVPGIEIIAVPDLRGAVAWHRGEPGEWRECTGGDRRSLDGVRASDTPSDTQESEADIADIIGQTDAIDALMIAAAGRHHLAMIGPPGAGKTLLARSLPTLLPDLTPDESILVSSIASLGGDTLTELRRRPPFESPHHTATTAAIIGSSEGRNVRPGALTRASHGVLFLDEAPEFSREVLDNLRQPLESGTIAIQRARVRAVLPARAQLVLASNPCPCGYADVRDAVTPCQCAPAARIRYIGRISGPLKDRIDIRLAVNRVSTLLDDITDTPRPTSAELRQRIVTARERAAARLRATPWRVNAEVPGHWLRSPRMRLPRSETVVLDRALDRGILTGRGYDRTLRLGWTLADLTGKSRPGRDELAYALTLRGGATW